MGSGVLANSRLFTWRADGDLFLGHAAPPGSLRISALACALRGLLQLGGQPLMGGLRVH
jgi:hypothetical protein